jgi:putative ATP-binding cassette transporter
VALIYAAIGTAATHWIGRPLINLNFQQQRYEADFRFNLMRVRENSEQIALLKGEAAEDARLQQRFSFVINNWWAIMARLKRLTLLTQSYRQMSTVFPFIVVSPAYFAGSVQLGGLMQTTAAFESVREALSVFIDVYRELAEWRAVIARLDGFDAAIAQAEAAASAKPSVEVLTHDDGKAIALGDLTVRLPSGKPLVAAANIAIEPGDNVLVSGPSGAGKSTLFRAIAGIWPFGSGAVRLPAGARVMILPQRPYFPVSTLADAVSYPEPTGTFGAARSPRSITAVGACRSIVERLDQEEACIEPGGCCSLRRAEQRLGIARVDLQKHRLSDFSTRSRHRSILRAECEC